MIGRRIGGQLDDVREQSNVRNKANVDALAFGDGTTRPVEPHTIFVQASYERARDVCAAPDFLVLPSEFRDTLSTCEAHSMTTAIAIWSLTYCTRFHLRQPRAIPFASDILHGGGADITQPITTRFERSGLPPCSFRVSSSARPARAELAHIGRARTLQTTGSITRADYTMPRTMIPDKLLQHSLALHQQSDTPGQSHAPQNPSGTDCAAYAVRAAGLSALQRPLDTRVAQAAKRIRWAVLLAERSRITRTMSLGRSLTASAPAATMYWRSVVSL